MPGKDDSASDPRRLVGAVVAERYRVEGMIGEGGMGAVYRAIDVTTQTTVAMKVLHLEMLEVEEAVARFEREAIAGAHVRHPNVAAASDFGKLADGSHFLVLEFLDGEDLRSAIAEGPLATRRALKIAAQIGRGLRACHTLGIVHRDLKPENVMLLRRGGERDVVKILDFGIAKVPVDELGPRSANAARVLTQLGMVYGTPEYMAPEQALGQEIDGRADVYALGVLLYEMLSGSRPFDAADRATLLAKVTAATPPSLSRRGVSGATPELERLVSRLLSKRADDRFADAGLAADAIERVCDRLDSAMKEGEMPQPSLPGGRRQSLVEIGPPAHRGSLASIAQLADSAPARHPSAPIVSSAIGLAAIVVLVTLATALRSSDTVTALEALASAATTASAAPPAASGEPTANGTTTGVIVQANARASDVEIETAKAGGLVMLGPLAQRYPTDPFVLKALLLAYSADRSSFPSAMRVAKHLFDAAPAAVNDEEVRQVILMAANGTPDAATAAFEVMTHMGSAGPDLIYELAVAPSVGKLPKDRAIALLADETVLARGTPALRIANELRIVQQACQRKPLLTRARDDGDTRTLHYLKPLQATTGCGFFHRQDCYGCFGNRKELNEAIDAIERRLLKK